MDFVKSRKTKNTRKILYNYKKRGSGCLCIVNIYRIKVGTLCERPSGVAFCVGEVTVIELIRKVFDGNRRKPWCLILLL